MEPNLKRIIKTVLEMDINSGTKIIAIDSGYRIEIGNFVLYLTFRLLSGFDSEEHVEIEAYHHNCRIRDELVIKSLVGKVEEILLSVETTEILSEINKLSIKDIL